MLIALAAESLRQASREIRFEFGHKLKGQTAWRLAHPDRKYRGHGIRYRRAKFEELRAILDGAPGLPLGICFDTAHAFEAGYEIHTAEVIGPGTD